MVEQGVRVKKEYKGAHMNGKVKPSNGFESTPLIRHAVTRHRGSNKPRVRVIPHFKSATHGQVVNGRQAVRRWTMISWPFGACWTKLFRNNAG